MPSPIVLGVYVFIIAGVIISSNVLHIIPTFISKRFFQMIFIFIVFQSMIFFLLQAQPGDITNQFLANPNVTPEARAAIARQFGLDKPLHIQWLRYLANFWFEGNLGVSWSLFPRPVGDVIIERLPRTLFLFLTASLISFWLGFVTGKTLAWNRGGLLEYPTTVLGVMLFTVFTPWFGLMMIWFFGSVIDLLPIGKFITVRFWAGSPWGANQVFWRMIISSGVLSMALFIVQIGTLKLSADIRKMTRRIGGLLLAAGFVVFWVLNPLMLPYALDIGKHLILPVATVTLVSYAGTMLLTRSAMLETLREDYIMTAKAKGLSDKIIRDKHVARNALLPVVTSLLYAIAFSINGGIITETIFSWPGLGLTILSASQAEDIPLATGALVVLGIIALVAHFVADILYVFLDPRIRVGST